ncbi:hypothetical protein QFZ41_002729 [Luteibacter sp. W1I16]|uniref:hypothetical protein n=1 Tax=Luteibacter sp. W1I16 TaxID=3373922 RepID=UPI003D1CC7C5
MSELKRRLAQCIRWGRSFPEGVFSREGLSHHYFFETPILGRHDLAQELERLLVPLASSDIVVSVGYERDGTFDEFYADVTTWISHGAHPFSGAGAKAYRANIPSGAWDGLIVASSLDDHWILFEDPAEPIGVLATRDSLAPSIPDPDLVFEVRRFLELIDAPSLGLTEAARRTFRVTYANEVR